MSDHPRTRYLTSTIAVVAVAAAAIAMVTLLAVSAKYPLPILIGARPVPLFAGLTLAAALAAAAVVAEPSSRHPSVAMPMSDRYRVLGWWIGVTVVLALLSYAAWKGWGVVAMFAAIAASVKVLHVASLIRKPRSVQIWEPFAMILGSIVFVMAIGQFLDRTNLPPPIQTAMTAYHGPRTDLAPASRPAPDVSSTGLTLRTSGDLNLGGLPSTLYSYDDREGSRVDVYEADFGFPAPQGSVGADAPPGWLMESDRLSLRTGPKGSDFLVVSWSTDVVDRIAHAIAPQPSA